MPGNGAAGGDDGDLDGRRDHRHGGPLPVRRPGDVLVEPSRWRRADSTARRPSCSRRASEAISDPAYVRAAAVLDDIDQFDAAFFGISPRDAVFDPQHRLFSRCAWKASRGRRLCRRGDRRLRWACSPRAGSASTCSERARERARGGDGRRVARAPHRQRPTSRHACPTSRPPRAEPQRADGVQLDARRRPPRLSEPAQRRVRRRLGGAEQSSPPCSAAATSTRRARSCRPTDTAGPSMLGRPEPSSPAPAVRSCLPLARLEDGDNVLAVARFWPSTTTGTKVGYLAPSLPDRPRSSPRRWRSQTSTRDVTLRRGARHRHADRRPDRGRRAVPGVSAQHRRSAVLRHRFAEVEHRPHRGGRRHHVVDQDGARASTARSCRASTSRSPTHKPTSRTARSS